jgi:hypothetical protein
MSSSPRFPNPVAKQKASWLRRFGWECSGVAGSGHFLFEHAEYEPIEISCTPKRSGLDATLAEIGRKTGKTKREVQIALGLRNESRKSPRRKRSRNEAGRRARTFTTVTKAKPAIPVRVGTPKERLTEIAQEIGAVDQGLNHAMGDEYDSLLSERARLRHEYCQLECAI